MQTITFSQNNTVFANRMYLILSGVFIASLILSNLIFQKFFSWNPFGIYDFQLSVGILPYPITFLITDLISEIYGRKKANEVVIAGLFSSLFVLLVVYIANEADAVAWSPLNNVEFSKVFGLTIIAVGSSMMAYLLAQLIDIRLFHFWKKLTKGKHLWLRNNGSTIVSQLVDTATVLLLLSFAKVIAWEKFTDLLINGFLFKVLVALLDTPVFYILTHYFRKRFNLKPGEEISI
ncbi:MAG: queuosine precursor transporter [Bacteroidetes bacterium]|nr:queuosine precursor transporter [Bacteroidota bacterium]HET6244147.1 queuosine precursor transporter [Bacteroidia bacterium]